MSTVAVDVIWTLSQWVEGHAEHHSIAITDYWWAVLNAADEIRSGGFVHMYAGNGEILVAVPAFQIFLAGLVKVCTLCGMAAPAMGLLFAHGLPYQSYAQGSSWIPVTIVAYALGLTPVFPIAALARRCGLGGWRLAGALIGVLATLSWAIVIWGHPDDTFAVALMAWALLGALDGRWTSAGWIAGAAIAVQPLALLGAAMFLVLASARRWPRLVFRMVLPSVLAVAIPLIGDFHDTFRQVFLQPTYPHIAEAADTPWLAVVPHPAKGVVYAGWPRSTAILLALAVMWVVAHRMRRVGPVSPEVVLWLVGFAFVLRCLFEAVLLPYYAMPAVALLLAVAATRGLPRMAIVLGTGAASTWLITVHPLGPWGDWLLLWPLFGAMLVSSLPRPRLELVAPAPISVLRPAPFSSPDPIVA